MSQAPSRVFDQTLLSAWQDELKAICNPIIKETGLAARVRPAAALCRALPTA
jgi:hypothetical protein